MFALKSLSTDAIPAALAKAERYRLLNEPVEAESICLDVLAVDPHSREALVTLLLALTDQFEEDLGGAAARAQDVLRRFDREYDRQYYAGIIAERRARAVMRHTTPGSHAAAYEYLRDAMTHFERAEALRPPGNDDALLRWNTCVRLLQRHPQMRPAAEERFEPMLE
jgi:hypothetical protein